DEALGPLQHAQPGQRRIGFVCNGTTFCPFPDDKTIIPQELMGAITQQNPIMQNILPLFERIQQEMGMVLQQINQGLFKARGFDIAKVNLDEELPDDINALVVFGPKSSFSDYQLYQMDQFVMRGGSLVVFMYPWDIKMQLMDVKGGVEEQGTLTKNSSNIDSLLSHWGMKPTGKMLVDKSQNGKIALYVQFLRQGDRLVPFQQSGFDYPALPSFTDFDTSDPLVRATTNLTLPWPTSFELASRWCRWCARARTRRWWTTRASQSTRRSSRRRSSPARKVAARTWWPRSPRASSRASSRVKRRRRNPRPRRTRTTPSRPRRTWSRSGRGSSRVMVGCSSSAATSACCRSRRRPSSRASTSRW
ncbi:MAG TPA: Gldg family protein, partial [Myxococcota bacterium]|nr:Gldg family protein [Myxococcota bacterium]